MIAKLFALSTSGDQAAVADCYAAPMRSQPGFADFAARWADSGPASDVRIRPIDRVKGCDRFAAEAELARGERVAHFGRQTTFFSVGPENGLMRIYDAGSAIASAEVTRVSCP